MQEQIVGFEVAKLAKYKGFDWEVKTYFDFKKFGIKPVEFFNKIDANNFSCWNFDLNKKVNAGYISAPTQSQLQDWLREEHRIDVMPTMSRFSRTYGYKIFYIEGGKTEVIDSQYIKQSFNSAFEIGLLKALKLIKND